MTNHCSALNLLLNVESIEEGESQIIKARDLITPGRYLITIYENLAEWEPRIPWDSKVISATMGSIEKRTEDWEFFGNGVIRCYDPKKLKLQRTLNWIIVKKAGPKPYVRKKDMSPATLDRNYLPVADKVFTRDVANNVWHIKNEKAFETIKRRFSRLLCWDDEEFLVVDREGTSKVIRKSKLQLKDDLVGVPTKYSYLWNNEGKLF